MAVIERVGLRRNAWLVSRRCLVWISYETKLFQQIFHKFYHFRQVDNQDSICTLKSTMAASYYIHTSLLFTVIQ